MSQASAGLAPPAMPTGRGRGFEPPEQSLAAGTRPAAGLLCCIIHQRELVFILYEAFLSLGERKALLYK